MARADVTINPISNLHRSSQSSYTVYAGGGIYVVFASQVDSGLYWTSSNDGGLSWTSPVLIKSLGGSSSGFAVWYDAWTPSDSGTILHLAYFEQAGDDVFYRPLNLSTESLGTEVTIFAGASTGAAANTCISITKAIGGNIYVAFDIDGGTETGFYYSTDAGASFSVRTDVNEVGGTDYYLLAPGFGADTNDIICIFWDRSANEISRKLFDVSANSWSESSIATSMTSLPSSTAAPQFSLTVDDPNNKILLAAWSAADTANADLRFWSLDESTITEKTNIVQNSVDDQGMVALALATDTSTLYAFYGGKSDGSETFPTAITINYKTSPDLGTTWGNETQLSLSPARGFDYLMSTPLFMGNFFAVFELQSTIDNLLFSVLLPSSGGNNVAAPVLDGFILQ